jgi:hypothetical protein
MEVGGQFYSFRITITSFFKTNFNIIHPHPSVSLVKIF